MTQLESRFMQKVEPVTETGCWIWMAGTNGDSRKFSYGQMYDGNKTRAAHRLSYELFVGPIPAGLFVCHRCDVPLCVNPAHLFVGTQSDNMLDASRKGRTTKAYCIRGHELSGKNVYVKPGRGDRNCVTCKIEHSKAYSATRIRVRPTKTSYRKGMNVCRRGHPFTEESTYMNPDGKRRCRICQRAAKDRLQFADGGSQ